jgi:nicotinate-nucleotide--dimethylbenzimidazole phosphoribosyltransferase
MDTAQVPLLRAQLEQALLNKTKPPGSLGVLESIAMQAGCLWRTPNPAMSSPHIVVFAADHGIAATGLVNPYPQAVTAQMVYNFLQGGAAINVLCRLHDVQLHIADAGVNHHFDNSLPLHHLKVGYGTRNYTQGPAMTPEEWHLAVAHGSRLVAQISQTGCNTIGFGEMGIGNSSSATLLMHHITRLPLEQCTGLGTGASPQQYATKLRTLEQAARLHQLTRQAWSIEELQCRVGGYELAMMYGAYLAAVQHDMLILVDGFIAGAVLMCAWVQQPTVLEHCLFAHLSGEKGHLSLLRHMGATPLLQLGMRLGEGTGAAMAVPVVRSALAILAQMATFESAAVSKNQ